jgi:multidrug efflux pump subunit AcrA (membrane-fusion protein)
LRPNAFAEVTFTDPDTVQKVVVPAEAVVTDGQTAVVFVRQEVKPGHFRFSKRVVVPGRSRDGRTEIQTGLKPGETFVSRGAILLLNALDLES